MTTFGDSETEKCKFHYSKNPINISNVDIDETISDQVSFGKKGFKYFICYNDDEKVMYNASKNQCIYKKF